MAVLRPHHCLESLLWVIQTQTHKFFNIPPTGNEDVTQQRRKQNLQDAHEAKIKIIRLEHSAACLYGS